MKKIVEKNPERVWYLEYLRIIATVAVIVLHVAAQNFYGVDVESFAWKVFNCANGLVRWSVPVFLMISGALFLDNEKEITISKLYKKYIWRLIVAFIFWSAIYALTDFWKGATLRTTIKSFITGPSHLWYIFMIIGLYIITPMLRKITESEKITKYFLAVTFVMTVFLPRCASLAKTFKIPHTTLLLECYNAINSDMQFHFTMGYVGYFVLGYYLSKKECSVLVRRLCCVVGAVGMIATVCLTDWYSIKIGKPNVYFYAHFAFCTVAATIGLFVFCKYYLSKFVPKGRTAVVISKAAKYSFGVYMVHMLILNTLKDTFHITTVSVHPVVGVIGLSVVTLVISYIIVGIILLIPKINKYIV